MKSVVYVDKVLVAAEYAPVKILSIADPSIFVTVQMKAPQVDARPLTLVAAESVQLKTAAVSLTL